MEKDLNQDKNQDQKPLDEAETNTDSNDAKTKDQTPEEKILKLEDKVARTLAEMENQRRRYEKEKEEAFEYGGFNFAREALNLIDNLERAKQSLLNDQELKNSEVLKKTLEHFDILNNDLISIFSKNNIKPIVSIGKKLDPNLHQAMMEIEDDHKDPGTIVQEIQKGFTIKDRLLRPALVGVSKKANQKMIKKVNKIKKKSGDK